MKTNSLLKRVFVFLILILISGSFVWYYYENQELFSRITFVSPTLLIVILFLIIFQLFLIGMINRSVLQPFNVHLGKIEAFEIAVINRFANYISPFKSGIAAKAFYLKKRHGLTYTYFITSIGATQIIAALIAGLIGMLAVSAIYLDTGKFNWIILGIFSTVLILLPLIILSAPRLKERRSKWINRLIQVINGWDMIRSNRKAMFQVMFFFLLQRIAAAYSLFFLFRVFGLSLGLHEALFLSSISYFGFMIGITPAGFGVQEWITVFSALTVGIGPAESMSVALLRRAVNVLALFMLVPLCGAGLFKINKNPVIEEQDADHHLG